MLTTTENFDVSALTTLIAEVTVLGTDLKMGLNTAIVNPTKQLVVGDMVEPTYAGYARQAVAMGTPFRDQPNQISALSAPVIWQQGVVPTPCLIQGIFFMSGTLSAVFVGYEPLVNPFQMNDLLDMISVTLQYIQSSQRQGFGIIVT